MSFTIGSLFDGSGGFPLAAFLCGGVPVWASEIEPYPIAVTRSRFPYMQHLGSVTDVKGNEIEPVDVVTFGSPCQDLSVAGKRAGLKHETNGDDETTRSGLFMEAVRIIREMREATNGEYPKFAVWENVPGAFSSNKGEDFRIVLEELIKICEPRAVMPSVPRKGWSYADSYRGDGWSLAYRVFDAQYWGVPQRRRRIYLILDLTGQRARQVLFERDGLRGYFAEGRTPWEGVAADAAGSTGADGDERSNGGALTAVGFPLGFRPENTRLYDEKATTLCNGTRPGFCNGVICVATQQGGAEISENNISPTVTASAGMSGNNQPWICYRECVKDQYLFENHSQDTRYTGPLVVCPMLPAQLGTGGNNTPFVVEHLYCFDGDKIGKAERSGGSGLGIRPGDKMYTLTAKDAGSRAVSYCIGNGQVNDAVGAERELCKTLNCMDDPMKVCIEFSNKQENYVRYIVRRLTPTECARLQGFADNWAVPERKDSLSDEEYTFWLEVRNRHAEINGKQTKDYTQDQMLRWYNKLHTDSSEYKLWGNGIALPCALYVMQGITDTFERA